MHIAITKPSRNTNFRVNLATRMILISSLLLSTVGQAADPVGTLKFARGDITIESSSGETRKAVTNENLMQNELIVTGAASIAVIQLNDDSKMTLRPYSAFRVMRLDAVDDGSDSSSNQGALLNLLRGGLRLVTGLIGKVNPAGYRVSTPVATIGIRGTEFNTRICSSDCAAEERQLAGSDAAAEIKEGLYVNVDEGQIILQNFADGEPLEVGQGESGYVSDVNSVPIKLSSVPAFQSQDKIPSPSELDFDDIQISDDALQASNSADDASQANDSAAGVAAIAAAPAAALAAAPAAAAAAANEEAAELDIAGEYEIDEVKYGKDLPLADRKWFFGSKPDLEFTLTQKGDKIEGEFEGDRDGVIKGKIDDREVTFTFQLEAKGGEIKDGEGTWIVQEDGSLKGDFLIRDRQRGVVRGFWTLVKDD